MKNIHSNFLAEYILKLSGEYASANRIHDILNISLSYTYTLVKNNKVRSRIKKWKNWIQYGRFYKKFRAFI